MAVAGDGELLAAISGRNGLAVFEVEGSKRRFTIPGSYETPCAVSPDGTRVASVGKPYDSATGKEAAALKGKRPGDAQSFPALAFAPDGKTLFGTGDAGRLLRWSAADGSVLEEWQLQGGVKRIAVVAGGRYLFTSNNNGTIYVFRLAPPRKKE